MGTKKRQRYEEKTELVEYYYKNSTLIDSIYSQLFQGNISSVERTEATDSKITKNFKAGIPQVAEGLIKSESGENELNKLSVDPLDYKVAELLETLKLKEPNKKTKPGTLVKVTGSLEIYCKPLLEKSVPYFEKVGMFDELYASFNEENAENNEQTKFSAEDLLSASQNLMPDGMTAILCTDVTEYLCLVEDEYFTIDPEKLAAIYGSKLYGDFVVAGVFSRKPHVTLEELTQDASVNNMARALFSFQQARVFVLNPTESEWLIRPFIIYRELHY